MTDYSHDRQRTSPQGDCSGQDMDTWGGEDTKPILAPKRGDDCVAHVDGKCPAGCAKCISFLDEMGRQEEFDEADHPDPEGEERSGS